MPKRKLGLEEWSELYNRPRYRYTGSVNQNTPRRREGDWQSLLNGSYLRNAVTQRNNAVKTWGSQGVQRVAKIARQAERKAKVDNQILVKVPRREQPTGLAVRAYDSNDAFNTVVEDALRASQNRNSRLGIINKGHIVTGLPIGQVNALRTLIKEADTNKDGSVSGRELSNYYYMRSKHGYTGGARSTDERLKDDIGQLEHTLGQFNYHINPLSGDTIVTDTYDFNKKDYSIGKALSDFAKQYRTSYSFDKSSYPLKRWLAGKVATHDDEPDNWKRYYRVNITRQSGYSK